MKPDSSRFVTGLLALAMAMSCTLAGETGQELPPGEAPSTAPLASQVCAGVTCGGHGVCQDPAGSAVCVCDEGFAGASCTTQGDDFYARTLVMPGMADPDIYKENDDLFFLSGTGNSWSLPIYETNDLKTYRLKRDYNPSAVDSTYDYCFIWAPDLSKYNGVYTLSFSAHRVLNGAACPPAGQEVTTFLTTATDLNLNFGVPQPINANTAYPRTSTAQGCLPQGCNRNIRIDAATVNDTSGRWFFYTWFDRGNNISSYNMAAPGTVYNHTGPAIYTLPAREEGINEGAEILKRNGLYYLIFSGANYNSQYAMYYIMGNSIPELNRARAVWPLSQALRTEAGALVQTHGHNSVVERRGEYFNFFHQGVFNPPGTFTGRNVYKQRMGFKPDGSMHSLNQLNVRWSKLTGYDYSLDLVLRDGTVVGPCTASVLIGSSNKTTFNGVCFNSNNRIVNKGDIKALRIFYSNNSVWNKWVEQAYDGVSDEVFLEIPGGTTPFVDLAWSQEETAAEYSIDVQRRDTGAWVGPCIGDNSVGKTLSRTYTGRCDTPGINVAISNIQAFRVCSAVADDWAHARCGTVPYDGKNMQVQINIP